MNTLPGLVAARLRWLSEEQEQKDRDLREEIHSAELKLNNLKDRRADLLGLARRLGEEALTLQDRRGPLYDEVEQYHQQYRDLGRLQAELRAQRERARARVEELLNEMQRGREKRRDLDQRPRPERLTQEIAQLERRQQTSVMTLKEENALITRIRELRAQLSHAEKTEAVWKMEDQSQQGTRDELARTRQVADELNAKVETIRIDRQKVLDQVKGRLVEIGHLVGEIRARGKARSETLEKVDALGLEIRELERSVMGKIHESRELNHEARRTLDDHNRTVRGAGHREEEIRQRTADDNPRTLFQKGKIEL